MTEIDVALTDYALTLLSGAFAWTLARRRRTQLARSAARFFAALTAASCLGGTVHGFAHDPGTWAYALMWRLTLLSMGGVAAGLARVAADILRLGPQPWLLAIAGVYSLVVIGFSQSFRLAAVAYLTAACLFLLACLWRRRTEGDPAASLGVAAMLLTFVGSFLQQAKVALPAVHLSHNALFHLVEAPALVLLFVALDRMATGGPTCKPL